MSRVPSIVALPVAIGLGLAGCGGGETLPAPTRTPSCAQGELGWPEPPAAIAQETPRGTQPLDMQRTFVETADADPNVTTIQKQIGSKATAAILDTDLHVCIDGVPITVRLRVPDDPEARRQAVIVTADSKNAGTLLTQQGIAGQESVTNSVTVYGLDPVTLKRQGPALSVIGQELTGVGLAHNATAEFCQPLDMTTNPPASDPQAYLRAKEAACNLAGIATDRALLGWGYEQYVKDVTGQPMVVEAGAGHDMPYVPVPRRVYAAMQSGIGANRSSPNN